MNDDDMKRTLLRLVFSDHDVDDIAKAVAKYGISAADVLDDREETKAERDSQKGNEDE